MECYNQPIFSEYSENSLRMQEKHCSSQPEGIATSNSTLTMLQTVLPYHANAAGRMCGGEVMKLMDSAAFAVAVRHCRQNAVTASVTHLSFIEPAFIGDLVICNARITHTGKTSMEVHVTIHAEHAQSCVNNKVSEGYFLMVALDRNGRPAPVPSLNMKMNEDHKRSSGLRHVI